MQALPPIPPGLLPSDGRFGAGPSRVRTEQLDALSAPLVMGTSHRQAPVRGVVASLRAGLADLFGPPDGYEVVLGNGGATAFWSAACASLVIDRAAFAVFGEFGRKFAAEAAGAPHLAAAIVDEAPDGRLATVAPREGVDAYAYPHNETSTGVVSPLYRPAADALTLVDATSIAGAAPVDLADVDAYYFSLQKAFGSDGGLWVAVLSPAAVARTAVCAGMPGRWVPSILDLGAAIANSRKDQTLNTPAVATLVMAADQVRWMNESGGLEGMSAHVRASSDLVYRWAEDSLVARPFVEDARLRSPVVATIEFDPAVDAAALAAHLRSHGVVDVNPYRGVGENQLRIATWPSIPTRDVEALLACIDYCLERAL